MIAPMTLAAHFTSPTRAKKAFDALNLLMGPSGVQKLSLQHKVIVVTTNNEARITQCVKEHGGKIQ